MISDEEEKAISNILEYQINTYSKDKKDGPTKSFVQIYHYGRALGISISRFIEIFNIELKDKLPIGIKSKVVSLLVKEASLVSLGKAR